MLSQAKPPVHAQQQWQCARNQQKIVEVVVQKGAVHARFEFPPVERVKETTGEEQRVAFVTKRFHSSASMTMPNAKATPNLNNKIIAALSPARDYIMNGGKMLPAPNREA